MKSYYFEEEIISEKMGCGAECTSSVIKNLNEADYIIKKAFKEINSHDKLSKVSFVSCSNKVAEIQCMYDNYIQSRDLYYEYGNKVDKKFTKEQEKVCDSLGDLNINKITVGDNLGVYDYQRPGSIKTLNLSVLLSYGDIDKALREDYEKQVKNIEYLRELVKLDDNQWPPEYTTEQVKAIKDYVKYLDDNEIKFDTYEKERQKFLESDDLNFITKGEERLSLILDFIPGVGLIKGGYETIVGVDPITKRKLSGVERAISGFACLLDAKGLYKIGKTAFKVSVKDGAKFGSKYLAKEFAKDTIGGYGFYAATQAADKAGIGPKGQLAIIGGLLAYGNRKNIAGAVSKADAKLKGINKGSFLDEMRLTNKAEYKRLMANLSDVTKDKKVYMSCFGAGTFEQIYKSNKNLREVTKILDNCKFTDLEKAEIHKLLSSGDKAEISKFSKVCASSAGDSKKIKEYLEGYSWKNVDSLVHGVQVGGKAEIRIGKKDLDVLRKKWHVPETNTVAVGKTDIPELKNFTFEGGSPEVRKEAGLPTLDEIFPNREFKAPYDYNANPRLAQFTRHAEEGVLNEFDEAIKRANIKPKDVSGTLYVHQSNPRGVCNKCTKGLIKSFPEDKCGIFYQASKKYPNLTIVVTSEVDTSVKVNGLTSFILKDGKIIN